MHYGQKHNNLDLLSMVPLGESCGGLVQSSALGNKAGSGDQWREELWARGLDQR